MQTETNQPVRHSSSDGGTTKDTSACKNQATEQPSNKATKSKPFNHKKAVEFLEKEVETTKAALKLMEKSKAPDLVVNVAKRQLKQHKKLLAYHQEQAKAIAAYQATKEKVEGKKDEDAFTLTVKMRFDQFKDKKVVHEVSLAGARANEVGVFGGSIASMIPVFEKLMDTIKCYPEDAYLGFPVAATEHVKS